MDSDALKELKLITTFMRENGVTHYCNGQVELTLHPSAFHLETDEITVEATGQVQRYESDYDNPDLYPDGVDPVAELHKRERKNMQMGV